MAWLSRCDGAELLAWSLLLGFVFVVSAAPLSVSLAVSPDAIDRGDVQLTPPCQTLERTGEPCPTCGLTRAFCAMSRFRFEDASDYHRGGPWLYAGVLTLAFVAGAGLVAIGREGLGRMRSD